MLVSAIKKIENINLSLWQIILLFYLASFFRGFLEVFVNSINFGRVTGPIDMFFHYPLWFIGVFLSVILIIYALTKEEIGKISSIVALGSFAILTPIIVDLILGNAGSVKYIFVSGSWGEIARSFFSFFGSTGGGFSGAPAGLLVEGVLGALFFGLYIHHKTKNIFKSILAPALLYCLVFLFATAPTFLHTGYNFFTGNNTEITSKTTQDFFTVNDPVNSVTSNRTFVSEIKEDATPFPASVGGTSSFIFSVFFLLVDIILGGIIFYLYSKKKFLTTIKNFRFVRIIYYYLFVCIGLFLGASFAGKFFINSLFDFFSVLAVFLSGTFAGLFCVWENDEVDVEIDKVSNKESVNRPLANGTFSLKEWGSIKYLFLFIALNFAFLCGLYQFVFVLLFVGVYHVYSAPPLRLKRFVGISSLLIAINVLITVWMGFFMASGSESLKDFPVKYLAGILIIVLLGENVKNLKDIKGDEQNGIKTLPVILGIKNSKLVIGAMVFLATVLVPILFFMNSYTFFTAVIFGTIFFLLINKEKFEEKDIFIFALIFAIVIACELAIIYGFPKK